MPALRNQESSHNNPLEADSPATGISPTHGRLVWLNDRPFYVHEKLGRGGFADVYRAELMVPSGYRPAMNEFGEFVLDSVDNYLQLIRESDGVVVDWVGGRKSCGKGSAFRVSKDQSRAERSQSAVSAETHWTSLPVGIKPMAGLPDGVSVAVLSDVPEKPSHMESDGTSRPQSIRDNGSKESIFPRPDSVGEPIGDLPKQHSTATAFGAQTTSNKTANTGSAKTANTGSARSGKTGTTTTNMTAPVTSDLSSFCLDAGPGMLVRGANAPEQPELLTTPPSQSHWTSQTRQESQMKSFGNHKGANKPIMKSGRISDLDSDLKQKQANNILESLLFEDSDEFDGVRRNQPVVENKKPNQPIKEEIDLLFGTSMFYALKIQTARCDAQFDAFVQEAKLLNALREEKHRDCVIQIQDFEVRPSFRQVVILMELASMDLAKFLKSKDHKFRVKDITRLCKGLVHAVDAAHDAGVLHFDLKPQNFLMATPSWEKAETRISNEATRQTSLAHSNSHRNSANRNSITSGSVPPSLPARSTSQPRISLSLADKIEKYAEKKSQKIPAIPCAEAGQKLVLKLADFGLARDIVEDMSHVTAFRMGGTLCYMAPESLHQPSKDGRKRLARSVDIWSLGIMLYQLLHHGKTPWDAYFALGEIRLALVIADQRSVPEFHRHTFWQEQEVPLIREKFLRIWSECFERDGHVDDAAETKILNKAVETAAEMRVYQRLLFRICESCLRYDPDERPTSAGILEQLELADRFFARGDFQRILRKEGYTATATREHSLCATERDNSARSGSDSGVFATPIDAQSLNLLPPLKQQSPVKKAISATTTPSFAPCARKRAFAEKLDEAIQTAEALALGNVVMSEVGLEVRCLEDLPNLDATLTSILENNHLSDRSIVETLEQEQCGNLLFPPLDTSAKKKDELCMRTLERARTVETASECARTATQNTELGHALSQPKLSTATKALSKTQSEEETIAPGVGVLPRLLEGDSDSADSDSEVEDADADEKQKSYLSTCCILGLVMGLIAVLGLGLVMGFLVEKCTEEEDVHYPTNWWNNHADAVKAREELIEAPTSRQIAAVWNEQDPVWEVYYMCECLEADTESTRGGQYQYVHFSDSDAAANEEVFRQIQAEWRRPSQDTNGMVLDKITGFTIGGKHVQISSIKDIRKPNISDEQEGDLILRGADIKDARPKDIRDALLGAKLTFKQSKNLRGQHSPNLAEFEVDSTNWEEMVRFQGARFAAVPQTEVLMFKRKPEVAPERQMYRGGEVFVKDKEYLYAGACKDDIHYDPNTGQCSRTFDKNVWNAVSKSDEENNQSEMWRVRTLLIRRKEAFEWRAEFSKRFLE